MARIHDWKVSGGSTSNATPLDILTITVPTEDFHGFVTAKVTGRRATGSAFLEKRARIRRVGGTLELAGAVVDLVTALVDLTMTGVAATVVVSGDNVTLRVTGLAATSIDWRADLQTEAYL